MFRRAVHAASSSIPRRCVTSACIFSLGDVLTQTLIEERPFLSSPTRDALSSSSTSLKPAYDPIRTSRMAIHAGLIFTPLINQWFKVVNRITHPNRWVQATLRVAVDQGVTGPTIPLLFFTSLTLLELAPPSSGKSWDEIGQIIQGKIRAAWFDTWMTATKVWIPTSFVNMAFVPVQNRVLVANIVSLPWTMYLSWKNVKAREKEEEEEEEKGFNGKPLDLRTESALQVDKARLV